MCALFSDPRRSKTVSDSWRTPRWQRSGLVVLLLREIHSHSIRAGLGSGFTHLIHVLSAASVAGGIIIQSIIRRCHDYYAIAIDVDVRRGRSPPLETHRIYSPHLSSLGSELNRSTTAHCSVEPVNLIGIHAFNTKNLSYPVGAASDVTARIPD